MKNILIVFLSIGLLACSGSVFANGSYLHSAEVEEIINIHSQMTELDMQLQNKPLDSSLNHTLGILEAELISKMKEYNAGVKLISATKKQAMEVMPAAGDTLEN